MPHTCWVIEMPKQSHTVPLFLRSSDLPERLTFKQLLEGVKEPTHLHSWESLLGRRTAKGRHKQSRKSCVGNLFRILIWWWLPRCEHVDVHQGIYLRYVSPSACLSCIKIKKERERKDAADKEAGEMSSKRGTGTKKKNDL